MNYIKQVFTFIVLVSLMISCKKDDDEVKTNPFSDPSLLPPPDTSAVDTLPYGSFQYIYHNVFKATCANSGCHDGNFPPDFRTIHSSYNTLVNHPVIINDAQNSHTYRVEPNNVTTSLLHTRLTVALPNTSGIMPAAIDSGSDYKERKDEYIKMIVDWISNGAPDIYGNVPSPANPKPQVLGIMVFNKGSVTNPLPREDNRSTGPIILPKAPVDVWFALADNATPVSDFKVKTVKSSYELFDFSNGIESNLIQGSSFSGKDFWDSTVNYTHMATMDFPSDTNNTFIYLRTYLQDGDQEDTTEIPNYGTSDIMRSYFTLRIDTL